MDEPNISVKIVLKLWKGQAGISHTCTNAPLSLKVVLDLLIGSGLGQRDSGGPTEALGLVDLDTLLVSKFCLTRLRPLKGCLDPVSA